MSCAKLDFDTQNLTPYGFQVWRPAPAPNITTAPSANGYANEGQQPQYGGTWAYTPCSGPSPSSLYYDSDADIAIMAQAKIPALTSSRGAGPLSSWCAVISFVNPHDIASYPGYFSTPSDGYSTFTPPGSPAACPNSVNDPYYAPVGSFYTAGVTPFSTLTSVTPTASQTGVNWNNNDPLSSKPALQSLYQKKVNNDFGPVSGTDSIGELPWQDFLNNYVWLRKLVDGNIGRIISAIPSAQAQNTVIVFSSDHGDYAGSHGLHGKGGAAYEEAINVPLYVLYPNGLNQSGNVQYYTRVTDYMCSAVDLFSLVVELYTGNGTWRSFPKYQDQTGRQSIFYLLAHPGSTEMRTASINGSSVPYILFTTDEIVDSENGAQCAGYPYNTPNHVTCMRTKTSKSVSSNGQITYSSTANSAKLVLYDWWPHGQDYPDGSVTQQTELYDYTYAPMGGSPNYNELGNQNGASSSTTIQAALMAALGTYNSGLWGGELQRNLTGVGTDGSTPLQDTPNLSTASVVGNALFGGNWIYGSGNPGSTSIGYFAYTLSKYYDHTQNLTCSGPDDASDNGFIL